MSKTREALGHFIATLDDYIGNTTDREDVHAALDAIDTEESDG